MKRLFEQGFQEDINNGVLEFISVKSELSFRKIQSRDFNQTLMNTKQAVIIEIA
jgi:hypothetical protein